MSATLSSLLIAASSLLCILATSHLVQLVSLFSVKFTGNVSTHPAVTPHPASETQPREPGGGGGWLHNVHKFPVNFSAWQPTSSRSDSFSLIDELIFPGC